MPSANPPGTRYSGRRRGGGGLGHLAKVAGPRSALNEFLTWLAWRDVQFKLHEFDDNTIDTTYWTANGGTGTTVFAYSATIHGSLVGATGTNGTASNRVANLYGPRLWSGDNYGGVAFRMRVGAAVTDIEWGAGFIDTHTTITTPVILGDVDDGSGLAAGMGDAAVIYQDTAETLATAALMCLGSGALNAGSSNAFSPTFAPTAVTDFWAIVQLDVNNVYAQITNSDGSGFTEVTKIDGMEGGTLVRPFLVISGPSATTKTWTIDAIATWGMR